jgi:hypothetical protein
MAPIQVYVRYATGVLNKSLHPQSGYEVVMHYAEEVRKEQVDGFYAMRSTAATNPLDPGAAKE